MMASVTDAKTRSVSRRAAWPSPVGRVRGEPLGHAEALGDAPAGGPGHALRADLREPPGPEALGLQARVQVGRDGEPEDRVPEEGEPRVGVRPPLGPRRVREHLPVEVLRQLRQKIRELAQRSACIRSPASATT